MIQRIIQERVKLNLNEMIRLEKKIAKNKENSDDSSMSSGRFDQM